MSLKMCHVWSISRSLGQILEKPCVRSRGHNFLPDNNEIWSECLPDEILNECKMHHVGSKSRSLGQILEKTCVGYRDHIF